jgi:hypothetical protein
VSPPLAIFTGYNIRYPLGGHVFTELQNIVGLQRLGYRVLYVEESGGGWTPCFDPVRNEMTADPSYGIRVLREELRPYGLADRWCYVDEAGTYHGLSREEFYRACRAAALLFGRSRVTWLPELAEIRTRIFLDVDPAITQFELPPPTKRSQRGFASAHDFQFHFTYGPRIGQPDCPVPAGGLTWRGTRPPVVPAALPWSVNPAAARFTTVMSWKARGVIRHGGVEYGDKNMEFARFRHLPRRTGPILEIALAGGASERAALERDGWVVTNATDATWSVARYLDYIRASRGEFSVAKNIYVATRCGWFSDRTVAYLALGRPAVVQDTGWSETLPTGEGLFAFRTEDEAVAALETIQRDYPRHCRAARRLAEEFFDAEKVLGAMLRQCDLPVPNCRAQSFA